MTHTDDTDRLQTELQYISLPYRRRHNIVNFIIKLINFQRDEWSIDPDSSLWLVMKATCG
ncbi:hypothetical protein Lspi_1749 [Legionella spiritensis]|uniref:Uncharacterized protein n=1 Tax=Legionella spiritensis TaxID=452 RepID=A0A0W0Z093_LEGSP|nr:hypothetical protein Lspi_1749 [Legionella spiritensis]SNV30756.1 Uncharacterised protein [Legionella spiritensis]